MSGKISEQELNDEVVNKLNKNIGSEIDSSQSINNLLTKIDNLTATVNTLSTELSTIKTNMANGTVTTYKKWEYVFPEDLKVSAKPSGMYDLVTLFGAPADIKFADIFKFEGRVVERTSVSANLSDETEKALSFSVRTVNAMETTVGKFFCTANTSPNVSSIILQLSEFDGFLFKFVSDYAQGQSSIRTCIKAGSVITVYYPVLP